MKVLDVESLVIPEVKVIQFARFRDDRGYFTELYREEQFEELDFMQGIEFVQHNESHSKKNVIRGLHFQWNPYMGKLVRTISGRMIDLVLDIRIGSQTYGKIIAHEMPAESDDATGEWIWVPPGFAHGNVFPETSTIEYLCTGSWNPDCEAGISPLSQDIDWSLCKPRLKALFDKIMADNPSMTDKDREGFSLKDWERDNRSRNFVYSL